MDGITFLKRAERCLDAASRTLDSDEKFFLHVEAVILTATAVECEVNWALFRRVLNTSDVVHRRYLNEITKRFVRARIREKLEFLLQVYPCLKTTSKERGCLKRLFDLRNLAVHATPELVEPDHTSPVQDRQQLELVSKNGISGVFGAFSLMGTARIFVERLLSV